jgi:hypothetical protein
MRTIRLSGESELLLIVNGAGPHAGCEYDVCQRSNGPNGIPEYLGGMLGTESGGSESGGWNAESGGTGAESTGGPGTEVESGGARESLGARDVSGPAERSELQDAFVLRTANVASAHTCLRGRLLLYEFGIYELCRPPGDISVGTSRH